MHCGMSIGVTRLSCDTIDRAGGEDRSFSLSLFLALRAKLKKQLYMNYLPYHHRGTLRIRTALLRDTITRRRHRRDTRLTANETNSSSSAARLQSKGRTALVQSSIFTSRRDLSCLRATTSTATTITFGKDGDP